MSSQGERGEEGLQVSFIKALIASQSLQLQIPPFWGLDFNIKIWEWRADTNVPSKTGNVNRKEREILVESKELHILRSSVGKEAYKED